MDLIIKKSKISGRGVFTKELIKKNDLIESCEIILIPQVEINHLDKTFLYNYYFSWENNAAIALGKGSLYNHSYSPNTIYKKDIKNSKILFIAINDIQKGEEICVNYNGQPHNKSRVWFDK